MPKLSAAVLVYRIRSDRMLEVLVAHPGGLFWAKKDEGAWSIPKGEYDEVAGALTEALLSSRKNSAKKPRLASTSI